MRRAFRWLGFALIAVLVARLFLGGLPPPALLPVASRPLDLAHDHFPPGTERVELALASGERLRGVFVPAGFGAPVVLHLYPAALSVAPSPFSLRGVFRDLVDQGFASLALDYRGIGESDGERSVTHLAEDARAMWDEAVRRAGGIEEHVVIRGASLGVLAACSLLDGGAKPAAVSWIAPVRADTVVERFAETDLGRAAALLSRALYRPVIDVDVLATIRRRDAPLFVASPEDDFLLPAEDRVPLVAALGEAQADFDGTGPGHERLVYEALDALRDTERAWLRRQFPNWPDADERLLRTLQDLDDESRALVSEQHGLDRLRELVSHFDGIDGRMLVALATSEPDAEHARSIVEMSRDWPQVLDPDWSASDLALRLDRADPAGDIPSECLESWRSALVGWSVEARTQCVAGWFEALMELVRSSEEEFVRGKNAFHPLPTFANDRSGQFLCNELWSTLLSRGFEPTAARRLVARCVLEAGWVLERVRTSPDGRTVALEARVDGAWRRVHLDWPWPDGFDFAVRALRSGARPAPAERSPDATPAATPGARPIEIRSEH